MLSGDLWPAHPHPYHGELFSCWLVRLMHANGIKVQTFCDREFDKNWQLWNRDIDRLAPQWLIEKLSTKTGCAEKEIKKTTLLSYHGFLFDTIRRAGELKWVMPLGIYHRTRTNHGLQFCPICLREDRNPYFRKNWRLAIFTSCIEHCCMLHEKCPECNAAVVFQRTELGKPNITDQISLNKCWKCNFDYTQASTVTTIETKNNIVTKRLMSLEEEISIEFFNLLHHFCKMISSVTLARNLEDFICNEGGIEKIALSPGRISFERRPLKERHYILKLCNWFIDDWKEKIPLAITKRAVRYNHLCKDFDSAPTAYLEFLSQFNRIIKKTSTKF